MVKYGLEQINGISIYDGAKFKNILKMMVYQTININDILFDDNGDVYISTNWCCNLIMVKTFVLYIDPMMVGMV